MACATKPGRPGRVVIAEHKTRMKNGKNTPTISQVADAAKVSRATVSRAFTRPELLSVKTVARIKEISRQLGYSPNQIARTLRTGRHSNVALVVPDIANPFFPPLIRAAQARADERGFSVFLGDTNEDAAREDLLVDKFQAQIAGLVLASSRLSEETIRQYAERKPLVLINRDIEGIPRVLINSAKGVTQAIEHLAALGHRSIVYVSGPATSWSNQQRRAAVRRSAQALGIETETVSINKSSYQTGFDAVRTILLRKATAAVAFDDLSAQGVLAGLAENGLKVPDDFSVVGCDDVLGAITYPPLTTVSARTVEAGRCAMDILIDMLQSREAHDVRHVLDTQLVIRATTGRPPASPRGAATTP
jgi:LacI family transcriptional regulator